MDLITLVCPPGAADYPVSHDIIDYQPDVYRADHTDPTSGRHVDLPPHVAVPLLHTGGFSLPKTKPVPPSGEFVRLVDKDGDLERSCGCDGVNYLADEHGVVTVPSEHAGVMCESFNFMPAPEEEVTPRPAAAAKTKAATKAA